MVTACVRCACKCTKNKHWLSTLEDELTKIWKSSNHECQWLKHWSQQWSNCITAAWTQSVTRQQHPAPCLRPPAWLWTYTLAVNFKWGDFDSLTFTQAIDHAYTEIVHWWRNIFLLPSGKAGRDFIRELSRLFCAYAECKTIEQIEMKAAMTMLSLLLQKPDITSKAKDHVKCLKRHLHQCSS